MSNDGVTAKLKKPVAEVFKRDKYCCVYCHKNLVNDFSDFCLINWDHLIPVSKGGSSVSLVNIVTSCAPCNSLKRAYDPRLGENYNELNFEKYVARARGFINEKKNGARKSVLYDDHQYWLSFLKNSEAASMKIN